MSLHCWGPCLDRGERPSRQAPGGFAPLSRGGCLHPTVPGWGVPHPYPCSWVGGGSPPLPLFLGGGVPHPYPSLGGGSPPLYPCPCGGPHLYSRGSPIPGGPNPSSLSLLLRAVALVSPGFCALQVGGVAPPPPAKSPLAHPSFPRFVSENPRGYAPLSRGRCLHPFSLGGPPAPPPPPQVSTPALASLVVSRFFSETPTKYLVLLVTTVFAFTHLPRCVR